MNTNKMTTIMAMAVIALAACAFIAPIQDVDAAELTTDPYMYEESLILELNEQVDAGTYFATITPAAGEPITANTNVPTIDVLAFVVNLVDGNYTIDVTNETGAPVVSGAFTIGTPVTPTTYTVTVDDAIANGTITATPLSGAENTTVTLGNTPADGYELDYYTVDGVQIEGNTLTLTKDVTVSAVFVEKQVTPTEPVEPTEIVYLTGILESEFVGKPTQIVVIDDDLTVKAGATITIAGKLIVESGVDVVFEAGSKITLTEGSTAEIEGAITVEAADADKNVTPIEGSIFTFNGKEMTIDGEVVLEGKDSFECGAGQVTINGTFSIEDEASASFVKPVNVSSTGTVNVYGYISGEIINAGMVAISYEGDETNTAGFTNVTIKMADGGVVDVINAFGTVVITDDGMSHKVKGQDVTLDGANTITLVNIAGANIVSELIEDKDKDGKKIFYKFMYLTGDLVAADDYKATDAIPGSIALVNNDGTKNAIQMDDETVLEVPMTITGTVDVYGTITALDKDNVGSIAVNAGDLNVYGEISILDIIKVEAYVNAAYYKTPAPNSYYVYTTLGQAIADGAKDITLTGEVVISEDLVVEPDMKVDATKATKITIKDTATVQVKYDAEERQSGKFDTGSAKVYVDGTLIAENLNKSKVVDANVISDTSKVDDDSKMYTNIYDALSPENVAEGDVVKITRDGDLLIKKDITIPAGVTLEIPKTYTYTVTVDNDVTVTVEGTLKAFGNYVMTPEVKDKKEAGETIVNGMMYYGESNANGVEYYSGCIVGAYFGYDDMDVIAPIETAAELLNEIESEDITLYGDMTIGDIEFVFTEDTESEVKNLVSTDDLTAGTITIPYGMAFTTANPVEPVADEEETDYPILNLTIAMANGSVTLENVYGYVLIEDVEDNSGEETVYIANATFNLMTAPVKDTVKVEEGTVTINGKVSVYGTTTIGVTVKVPAGSEMTTMAGTSAADPKFTGPVYIEGALVAGANAQFVYLTVLGTSASAVDEDGKAIAFVNAENLFVGAIPQAIVDEYLEAIGASTIGADASATGVKVMTGGYAYVAPGSTVGKEISDLKSTTFWTEDDIEYVTIYTNAGVKKIVDVPYDVENAIFSGWYYDKDGTMTAVGKEISIGAEGYKDVKATVKEDIYSVFIYTDEGIKSVAIDGINLVTVGGNVYETYYELVAGTHKVSFEYRDGYTGTVTMFVDKVAQSGYDFQLSGTDPEDREVTITLTGTVVADKDITIDVGGEGEGMSLTEILLIVLVVLILIMAIIVAMRMMRS